MFLGNLKVQHIRILASTLLVMWSYILDLWGFRMGDALFSFSLRRQQKPVPSINRMLSLVGFRGVIKLHSAPLKHS